MKQYRNTVTGVVINTPCDCAGENWEPVKKRTKAAAAEKEPETAKEEEAVQPEETKPEEAAEGGIEIGPAQAEAAPEKDTP